MSLNRLLAAGLLCVALAAPAQAQAPPDRPPDPALVRNEVNKALGIYAAEKPAPTLGRIVDVANLSIAFGAPTYNVGDIASCRSFYERSMTDILDLWGEEPTDPDTAEAITILRESVELARSLEGDDRQAWALRFGWDRVNLLQAAELMQVQGLLSLGEQSMARSQYPEAVSAYSAAAASMEKLVGIAPRSIDVELRFASLAEGHARLGLRDFVGASRAVGRGLELIPEWLSYGVDRAAHHPAGEHAVLVQTLEAAVREAPDNVDQRFLLAYEYAMTGRDKEAEKLLKGVLKDEAGHAGATILTAALAAR